uniref:Transposase, mutator type n=1 Tax=Tanacetum cinerariifolium TaxID=118510 RepID=A0A699H0R0_TANCI|nr:transposase, mutator type [Tanacetum cinerariifolium]
MTRTFRRVYMCLESLKQGFRACGREILGLDGCFMSGAWPGQIQTVVRVDANNEICLVACAIVEAESKESWCWFLNSLGGDLGRAKCDLRLNNICDVFNWQLVDGRDQPIITCQEYIREYLMKRIIEIQKVIAKIVGPLTPSMIKLFDAIKKRLLSTLFNGMEAHVYSFKVNPCNDREMWPVFKATTVRVPPLYKPQVGRPPKKRKKSHYEIANKICLSGKLSRKAKSVRCSKCGNASARQAASTRTVSGQAGGASDVSSQSSGSSQPITAQSTSTRARNALSQPSATPSTTSQGPTQHSVGPRKCFQAPRRLPTDTAQENYQLS